MGGLDQDAATALVKRSFDAGVNFIDTANVYSLGESETLTGNAIKSLGLPRDELILATKATGVMVETAINAQGQSRYHLMNQLDASLKRLQVDHIDLYQLHGFDPLTPLDDVLCTLNDMVRSGKVRYIGLSDHPAWVVTKCQYTALMNRWEPLCALQIEYSLLQRTVESELMSMARDLNLGVTPWSPLRGGVLSGKVNNVRCRLERVLTSAILSSALSAII